MDYVEMQRIARLNPDSTEYKAYMEKSSIVGLTAAILNDVAETAYTDIGLAFQKLKIADSLGASAMEELKYLRGALMVQICQLRNFKESDLQEKFFKGLSGYVPGAKKVSVKHVTGHIPDGFVSLNGGAPVPVEVKLKDFTSRSLLQLKRYMRAYSAPMGIAVAQSLKCKLPSDVVFVAVSRRDA